MVKVCGCESDCGIVLMDFNPVGMFSHSYALRYPLSGTNIVKSTIVAESESSREDLEANTTSKRAAAFRMLMDENGDVPVCTS